MSWIILRKKYTAHADKSKYEFCRIVITIPPKKKGAGFFQGEFKELGQTITSSDILEKCHPLIMELYENVRNRIVELEKKVFDLINRISPEALYELSGKSKHFRIKLTDKVIEKLINNKLAID